MHTPNKVQIPPSTCVMYIPVVKVLVHTLFLPFSLYDDGEGKGGLQALQDCISFILFAVTKNIVLG